MKKQVGFRLSENSLELLDSISKELDMTRTDVIEFLLSNYEGKNNKGALDDVVASLFRQLEEKDNQINQLLEQSRNYQVLLKQEQDTQAMLLKPKKVGLLRRLFGRTDDVPDDM